MMSPLTKDRPLMIVRARSEDHGDLPFRPHSPKPPSTIPTPAPEFKEPSTLVTISVGLAPHTKEFLVHKELLCKHSPVFAAGLDSSFKEGLTQTWRLEDTSEGAFMYLMQWLYSSRIPFAGHADGVDWSGFHKASEGYGLHLPKCSKEMLVMFQLWVLADKLLIPKVQNLTIARIHAVAQDCPGPLVDHLNYLYANTAEESPLRAMVVDKVIWKLGKGYWDKEFEVLYPKDFLMEVAYAFTHAAVSETGSLGRRRRVKRGAEDFFVPVV